LIYEILQVEDGANCEAMSRAHQYLVHELDTSFFTPDERKQKQQELLNLLWNGWHRSPESQVEVSKNLLGLGFPAVDGKVYGRLHDLLQYQLIT